MSLLEWRAYGDQRPDRRRVEQRSRKGPEHVLDDHDCLTVIAESGATSSKEMGAVMKIVVPRLEGGADGGLVNRIVRELLG